VVTPPKRELAASRSVNRPILIGGDDISIEP
jgi:hypothetical protein